ncbi:tetratricopeptide repeat protein 39C [Aplysia californica]|uniref:Tetratricopeptide repeat protein 39C n=1 Tax=Aplysia californica TaxID=6500 RepID=A0ABM0ZYC4_APLCA|nr:tetratricopeptide repeat protein 39C [Aplysia californica]
MAASHAQIEDLNASAVAGPEDVFDDVEMASTGINMLLNNGFDEAFALFDKYKNESPLMHSGYSFVFFMQALMSFEEDKLAEALKVLQETEKKCSTSDGFVKSFRKKFSKKKKSSEEAWMTEERITNQVIVADCVLYQAVLVFTNQDIPSYVKGGWLLRKAWKIYEKLHREVTQLMDSISQNKIAKMRQSFSSSVDPVGASSNVSVQPSTDALGSSKQDQHNGSAVDGGGGGAGDGELSAEVLSRLLGAVNFGYGTFQLCISMVPPKILKLIEFLGFEGDREVGLTCLVFTSHSRDMKAPLATLALLWYHTVLRPFFALDGANHFQAGTKEAETIIKEKEGEFPNSSLFLFFQGRIHRLEKENDMSLTLYNRALEEAKGQREIELMCLYEISWCHMLKLNWDASQDGFARLQKESKWSQAYYTYLVGVCLGSRGEVEGANDMFSKVPGLIKRKNNQIEAFVLKRAEKFKRQRPTQEHCRLLTLEMIFLWHALPTCTPEELKPLLDVCDMQSDRQLLPLKCMLEGAIYKELGEEEMAVTCLKEALARHQGKKDDMFIPAFTLFELASIYMKNPQTVQEARSDLQLIKDTYKDYDFENRLSVRVSNALKRLKTGSANSVSHK